MVRIGLFSAVFVMVGCAHDPPPQDPSSDSPTACGDHCFDSAAATRALDRAVTEIQTCDAPNDSEKSGNARITFEPTGRVSSVVLDAHLARSHVAECIENSFRKIAIPKFEGSAQTVAKVFSIRGSKDAGAQKAPNRDVPFDRGAAAAALGEATRNLSVCWQPDDLPASGHAKVTFAGDGQVSSVDIDQAPFQTDPSRICIATIFFRQKVPAFAGGSVTVGISFKRGGGSRSFSPTEENALKQAVSAIDFSKCNPHGEMPPDFYQVTIEFASDGSIARTSISVDAVKEADCVVEQLKQNVHASPSTKTARWLETNVRVPVSTFHVSVSP